MDATPFSALWEGEFQATFECKDEGFPFIFFSEMFIAWPLELFSISIFRSQGNILQPLKELKIKIKLVWNLTKYSYVKNRVSLDFREHVHNHLAVSGNLQKHALYYIP